MSEPSNHKDLVPGSSEVSEQDTTEGDSPLFRPQVLAERQSQWLGTVLLAPTVSYSLFAGFAAVAIVAIVSLLFFGDFARSEEVNGWLVPERGLLRVIAPQSGVVKRVHVADGDAVAAGDALVTLSTELQSAQYGATQQEIVRHLRESRDSLIEERKLHAQLLVEDLRGLDKRIATLESEEDFLAGELAIQSSQVKLARQAEDRHRDLLDRGLSTAQLLETAESNRLEQSLRLRALERQRSTAGRERLELEAEREMLPLRHQAKLAEHNRKLAAVEQELLAAEVHREFVITAAQGGTVTALRAKPGSSAGTSTPLLSILPADSQLRAQLFVPGKAVGFIKPGQNVRLRYESFPYQKFGHHEGAVSAISRSAVSPNELGAELSGLTSLLSGNEPVYLVSVELARQTITAYGEPVQLHPGMQLQASVVIESRRLIEWVFDPLYTMTGK